MPVFSPSLLGASGRIWSVCLALWAPYVCGSADSSAGASLVAGPLPATRTL